MIYESCILLRPDATEDTVAKVKTMIEEVVSANDGEVLVTDDWGQRTLAQPTSKGLNKGHYLYFMYKCGPNANDEIERRYRINEDAVKFLFVKLGKPELQESFKKNYKNPFTTSGEDPKNFKDAEKEKRMFSKRRSCWFSANKTQADWKDPSSYSWLINEFGKISPARVSGISMKHQKVANRAIKRARNIGLIGILSNNVAE